MINRIALIVVIMLGLAGTGCTGPAGPQGPPGVDALTDPNIKPQVIDTYPPSNSQGPYEGLLYPQVQIRFNKLMDPSSVKRAIIISANDDNSRADTGKFLAVGGDMFLIGVIDSASYPSIYRWKVGRTYSVSISTSAKDINGDSLQPPFSMTFVPEPYFRVVSITPRNGTMNVPFQYPITLSFNSRVDTSILSSIHISPTLSVEWNYCRFESFIDSTCINISYEAGFVERTLYTVTVETTAQDIEGYHLPQQFSSSFSTVPFRIASTYPTNGSTNVSLNIPIVVSCTVPIDTGTVRTSFRIDPGIGGNFSLTDGSRDFSFSVISNFAPMTMYTVTVDATLRSKNGTMLASPYVVTFTTGSLSTNVAKGTDFSQIGGVFTTD